MTPSAARRWPSRIWRSPPIRGRRRGSRTRDTSSPRSHPHGRGAPRCVDPAAGGQDAGRERVRRAALGEEHARSGGVDEVRPPDEAPAIAALHRLIAAPLIPVAILAGVALVRDDQWTRGSGRRHGRRCPTWGRHRRRGSRLAPDHAGLGAVRSRWARCGSPRLRGRRRAGAPSWSHAGGAHAGRDHQPRARPRPSGGPRGRLWVRVRPAGTTGWVRREALGGYGVVRTRLVVDRRALRATLLREGRPVFRAAVGIGAPGAPTPRGEYYIRNKLADYRARSTARSRSARAPAPRAHRLARGRLRRHPRHEPTVAHPGPRLARLHPAPQRRHPPPRPPHAVGTRSPSADGRGAAVSRARRRT